MDMKNVNTSNEQGALTPTRKEADETMEQLAHEAAEHQRVWGLVSSLASLVQSQEQQIAILEGLLGQTLYSVDQHDRIQQLEHKIVVQRQALKGLEECREFERETEQLLIQALDDIRHAPTKSKMLIRTNDAQVVYADRKGPRPKVEDASQ